MAGCAGLILHFLTGAVTGTGGKLLLVFVPVAAGVFVYFICSLLFGLEEARTAVKLVRNRIHL